MTPDEARRMEDRLNARHRPDTVANLLAYGPEALAIIMANHDAEAAVATLGRTGRY